MVERFYEGFDRSDVSAREFNRALLNSPHGRGEFTELFEQGKNGNISVPGLSDNGNSGTPFFEGQNGEVRNTLLNAAQNSDLRWDGNIAATESESGRTLPQLESNQDFVSGLYDDYLGHKPDENGFEFWVNKLRDGASREEVEAAFDRVGQEADQGPEGPGEVPSAPDPTEPTQNLENLPPIDKSDLQELLYGLEDLTLVNEGYDEQALLERAEQALTNAPINENDLNLAFRRLPQYGALREEFGTGDDGSLPPLVHDGEFNIGFLLDAVERGFEFDFTLSQDWRETPGS